MNRTLRTEIVERVLAGTLTPAEGAALLRLDTTDFADLLRRRARGGTAALAGGRIARLYDAAAGAIGRLRDRLRSGPVVAGTRARVAGAVASFALASVGVVMLTASSSLFPPALQAASAPDTVRMRLESNMRFADDRGVERQLARAGSVYDRVAAVLDGSKADHAALRRALAERRRAIDGVRLNYVKHGRNVPVNEAFRHRDGELYARMLEVFPPQELKSPAGLAAILLERAQNAERKMAVVRSYYAGEIRRPAAPAPAENAPAAASAVAAVAAAPAAKAVDAAPVAEAFPTDREAFQARIARLHDELVARRPMRDAALRGGKPFSGLAVISRFHRRAQIERAVRAAALPPPEFTGQMAM